MGLSIDIAQSEKFESKASYFNISTIFIYYFPYAIKLFYYLRIPHELLTLASISSGIIAGLLTFNNPEQSWLLATILIHLKDIFDASDGAIARLTGRGHRIGRFLDSLGDFLVLSLMSVAFSVHLSNEIALQVAYSSAFFLSIFLQCSYFNYYQLSYKDSIKSDRLLSRKNEQIKRDDFKNFSNPILNGISIALQSIYIIIYGWQDNIMTKLDHYALGDLNEHPNRDVMLSQWYQSKVFLVLNSVISYGTHIFIFIIGLVTLNFWLSFILIVGVLNVYWAVLIFLRSYVLKPQIMS